MVPVYTTNKKRRCPDMGADDDDLGAQYLERVTRPVELTAKDEARLAELRAKLAADREARKAAGE